MHGLVRRAVESYDLPDKIRQRVLERAERDITRLGLTGFDSQYRYVSELSKRFRQIYADRSNVSLDALVSESPKTTLHELLYDGNTDISIGDVYCFLGEVLHKRVLLQPLLNEEQIKIGLKLVNETVGGLQTKEKRVGLLISFLEQVEQDIRFIQPERKMIYVNLNSENPYVRFGNRRMVYGGDPLSYFRRHQDVYGRMSRNELQIFDKGLYLALMRRKIVSKDGSIHSLVEVAIPEKRRRTSIMGDNPLAYYFMNKDRYMGLSRRSLAKEHQVLYEALRKSGQLSKAIPKVKLKTHSQEVVQRVIESYSEYKGNAKMTARELKLPRSTVRLIWRRNGLKAIGKPGQPRKQKLA